MEVNALREAYEIARARLIEERTEGGFWRGDLSESALSTATSVCALAMHNAKTHQPRIERARAWLVSTQNADGGWGDTPRSASNIATSYLALAAFAITGRGEESHAERCRAYIDKCGGIAAVLRRYGEDRTFSTPILSALASAGLCSWSECRPLPYWLAALPRGFFRFLGLRVVSYALPALIGIGLAVDAKTSSRQGFVRRLVGASVLERLARITPPSGGYLEATPITGFVAMGLMSAGEADSPIVGKNIDFLLRYQAPSGSWRIEKDLAVWATTLSVGALGGGTAQTRDWLLAQQTSGVHPYTGAAPGAWGWTDSEGSVPDADDTAGALLALAALPERAASRGAALRGAEWLLDLQNRDGGWPTFCRGWQKLPFDQSCADITAHAMRGLCVWQASAPPALERRMAAATRAGFRFLEERQSAEGSWTPLWFGNEQPPGEENPVLGTARVLAAYRDLGFAQSEPAARAVAYLAGAQHDDGVWGAAPGVPAGIEESALACDALAGIPGKSARDILEKGLEALAARVRDGSFAQAAPIGLYFAKLWYFEKLYPIIFTAGALRRALVARGESLDSTRLSRD